MLVPLPSGDRHVTARLARHAVIVGPAATLLGLMPEVRQFGSALALCMAGYPMTRGFIRLGRARVRAASRGGR